VQYIGVTFKYNFGSVFNRLSYNQFTFDGLICWLILNYCCFAVTYNFQTRNNKIKPWGIWKCTLKVLFGSALLASLMSGRMYDIIPQNGDCPRESIARSLVFLGQSPLSECTIVAELGMERLTFGGHSSYKRLVLFCRMAEHFAGRCWSNPGSVFLNFAKINKTSFFVVKSIADNRLEDYS
jgi:hypothetical protein